MPPPRVSVVTVIEDGEPDHVAAMVESVLAQTYPDVELVIVTTSATSPALGRAVRAFGHDLLRVAEAATGDAAATALRTASGELLAWIAPGDVLVPDAIEAMVAAIGDETDGVDVVYCDHDLIDPSGAINEVAYKPDHSPERLRSQDFVTPFLLVRRAAVAEVGQTTRDVDQPAWLHDVALRSTEAARSVVHVPRVLVHTRLAPTATPKADAQRCRVVAEHCRRVGIAATVVPTDRPGIVRVVRRLERRPLVSVVIPTRGTPGTVFETRRCFVLDAVRSLVERSTYRELEFVVVFDADTPPTVLDELRSIAGDALVTVRFDGPFNFSAKTNLGVSQASGELLLLLNDDTELIDPASIEVMVTHLQTTDETTDVGMVGGKLLFEDGTLQHGGHVYHGKIHHACFGWPGDSPGPAPLFPLAVERECSGVTAAAALVARSVYDQVGGFDESLPLNYNDVDFSLKVRAAGFRIVWTPWASWFHFESRSRQATVQLDEVELIEARWGHELRHDPYYHPALSVDTGDWAAPQIPEAAPVTAPPPTGAPGLAQRVRERVVSTLLGAPPRRPRGVNLIGYLDATSGLGERARQLERVLAASGVRYSTWNLDLTESTRTAPEKMTGDDDGVIFDTTIAVVTALAFPGIEGVHGYRPLIRGVDRVIGYWFWELEDVPDTHRPAIELVDEIWAPTRFVRDAYDRAVEAHAVEAHGVDRPVELVPLPIGRPQPSDADRASFGFGKEFVFLTSFDHFSSMQRKHPLGVIEAFTRAFPASDERVRLVVKTINGQHRPDERSVLEAAARTDPRIELRDGYLDDAEQAALIRAVDAFVSLHRSEGLGLHIAEAMWLGTPVIATRYSGSLDLTQPFDGSDVAELVDARLVEVSNGGEAYRHGVWADPDLDQAAAAMQRLVADGSRRADLTRSASVAMEARAGTDDAGARVRAMLAARDRPESRRERVAAFARRARRR